jgi:hypothetical protein
MLDLAVGDTFTLWNTDPERGIECRVLYIRRGEPRFLFEVLDASADVSGYENMLIHKYQSSISLEII